MLAYALLIRRLKTRHPTIWVDLGSPRYFPIRSPSPNDPRHGAVYYWVRDRRYVFLGDAATALFARTFRFLTITVFVSLVLVGLLVIFGLFLLSGGRI